jgi:Ubiquitin-conjugating enzyme
MLLGIQELLDNPNEKSPAQRDAYELFVKDKIAYRKKIKEQALKNVPDSWSGREEGRGRKERTDDDE